MGDLLALPPMDNSNPKTRQRPVQRSKKRRSQQPTDAPTPRSPLARRLAASKQVLTKEQIAARYQFQQIWHFVPDPSVDLPQLAADCSYVDLNNKAVCDRYFGMVERGEIKLAGDLDSVPGDRFEVIRYKHVIWLKSTAKPDGNSDHKAGLPVIPDGDPDSPAVKVHLHLHFKMPAL